MTLPFYITLERDIKETREIADLAFQALENIGGVQIPRKHLGSGPWSNGPYGSMQWYVQQAHNAQRRQVNIETLLELYDREPWQDQARHFELGLFETDFYAPECNFVFGSTRTKITHDRRIIADEMHGGGHRVAGSLQSAARIRRYGDDFTPAFFGIILHELGHFYGLSDTRNQNFISTGHQSLEYGHCDDRNCLMEQVNITGRLDLRDKVKHVFANNARWFCDADYEALRANLQMLYR